MKDARDTQYYCSQSVISYRVIVKFVQRFERLPYKKSDEHVFPLKIFPKYYSSNQKLTVKLSYTTLSQDWILPQRNAISDVVAIGACHEHNVNIKSALVKYEWTIKEIFYNFSPEN